MALKNLFQSLKQQGLVKQIDQYLLVRDTGNDRVNITNSPSSALGCCRANYYQRQGIEKEPVDARVQRIFDNGHGTHERIQQYLTDMGVLYMDEVPLVHEEDEIQGHTDGIMSVNKSKNVVQILEIKTINSRQFSALKEAKEEHRAQANVYMYVAEEHRQVLLDTYPTIEAFKKSYFKRRAKYAKRYQHLEDGSKYTRAEKIKNKVDQHIKMDNILYKVKKPITQAHVLYECKDTQELKEFVIDRDEDLLGEVLYKYRENNRYWKEQELPCRECKNKSEGRWCNYVNHCFE